MASGTKTPLTEQELDRIQALAAAAAAGDFYAVLGVHRRASTVEIERSYKEFVQAHHPDRYYSRAVGELKNTIEDNFVFATRAFRTLKDDTKRALYESEFVKGGGKLPEPGADVPKTHEVKFARKGEGQTAAMESSARPPEPLKPRMPPVLQKMQQQVATQIAKARTYYDLGKADYDAGNYTKAESSLYLAKQCDPKNEVYAALYATTQVKARETRVAQFMQQAEQADQYGAFREAMVAYRKVIEADPPSGKAWFRLAELVKQHMEDEREALALLRKAVQKEPRNVAYRMALANLHNDLDMAVNAQREVAAVLEIEPKHEAARALSAKLKSKR